MKDDKKVPKRNWRKPIDCNGNRVKVGDRVLILCYDTEKISYFRPAFVTKITPVPNSKWCTKEILYHQFSLESFCVDHNSLYGVIRSTQIMQHSDRIRLIKDYRRTVNLLSQLTYWLFEPRKKNVSNRRNHPAKK